MKGRIVALGAAARENDFPGIGVNKCGDLGPGLLEMLGYLTPKKIGAGRIAPILLQKRNHRLDHFGSDSRSRVVIEIMDLRLAHARLLMVGPSMARTLSLLNRQG